MFTVEIRVNGGLTGVMHVQNAGQVEMDSEYCYYRYEYYEPSIGVERTVTPVKKKGSVQADPKTGLSGILSVIFNDMNGRR
jgi:hypothetical protein